MIWANAETLKKGKKAEGRKEKVNILHGASLLHSFRQLLPFGQADVDAFRCRILIAEVCELERDRKVFRPHGGNHGLKFVSAFAGHADLLVLNLGGHFEFRVADIAGDLFGNIRRNPFV